MSCVSPQWCYKADPTTARLQDNFPTNRSMNVSHSRHRCRPSGESYWATLNLRKWKILKASLRPSRIQTPGERSQPLVGCTLGAGGSGLELYRARVPSSLYLTPAQLNIWRAHSIGYVNDEKQYTYDFLIPVEQICQTTLTTSEELNLLGQILGLLGTKNVSPLGFSQQIEAQRCLPDKIFYADSGCHCRFGFRVEATALAFHEDWLSVEFRVCPTNILQQVRRSVLIPLLQIV